MTAAVRTLAVVVLLAGALSVACEAPSKDPLGRGLGAVRSAAAVGSAPLRCPADPWPVLSHDSARTGTSRGCCSGPLSVAWRFVPPDAVQRPARAQHVIAGPKALYVSGIIGQSPAVFRVSPTGELAWTFDSHVDITRFHWPALVLDRVVLNDDGLYILESRTGEREVNRGLDSWGEVLTDGENLFANNTSVELIRHAARRMPCMAALGHDRRAGLVGELEDRRHFLAACRLQHQRRPADHDVPVFMGVMGQIVGRGQRMRFAHDGGETIEQFGIRPGGHETLLMTRLWAPPPAAAGR